MMNWSLSPLARSWAIAGVRGFRGRRIEQRAVNLVHRDKGRGHAGRTLEEFSAAQALLAAEIVGHRQQPGLDLALPLVLRIGIELVAGHDLGRDRGLIGAQLDGINAASSASVSWLVTTSYSLVLSLAPRDYGSGLRGAETRPPFALGKPSWWSSRPLFIAPQRIVTSGRGGRLLQLFCS